jgi:hypothetical protein
MLQLLTLVSESSIVPCGTQTHTAWLSVCLMALSVHEPHAEYYSTLTGDVVGFLLCACAGAGAVPCGQPPAGCDGVDDCP